MKENIFLFLLYLLKVPHTYNYSKKYYNQYPLNNTLWGLSKMLLDYGIDSQTYHVKDKTRGLSLLEFPCVIYWGGNFVVFVRKDNAQVFYYWNGLIVSQPLDVFEKYWSGIVMFINTKKESIEPDYMRHVLSSVFLKFFF